ncbi:MAG TPA: transporter [Planctomycetaceae bacterium]|nr:transporter [Planctomycetaceae bacterium]
MLASFVLLGCAGFSGCKVGPNYRTPSSLMNDRWSLDDHPRLHGETADLSTWWKHFNDPILDFLINQSADQNLTLREAGARILESRARRDATIGSLFPQAQAANGNFSGNRISPNIANFFAFPGVFDPDLSPSNWTVGVGATWELDFWGRYRRAVESADASLDAACAAYDESRVLLLAEVGQTYVELRTLENRLELAKLNLQSQEMTLGIAQKRQEAGLGTSLDIAQAETNVGQTSATLPLLQILHRQANNRLCLLLGRNPTNLQVEIGFNTPIPHPPHNLAFGIPADLLRRRPDVRRAERELAAQSEKIGIAKTDFYPHITLTGNIGLASEDFSNLLRSSSGIGVISPGFSWNLLNYGRIKNNVKAEQAAFQARCHAYHNSVLKACQEAEDAQVAYIYGFDRADALHRAANGALMAVKKSEELFRAGTIDFGRVYILQAELLVQQDQLASAQGDLASNLINLFKALGGGWDKVHFHDTLVSN